MKGQKTDAIMAGGNAGMEGMVDNSFDDISAFSEQFFRKSDQLNA